MKTPETLHFRDTRYLRVFQSHNVALKRCTNSLARKVLENEFKRINTVSKSAGAKANASRKQCEREELDYAKSLSSSLRMERNKAMR